FEACGVVVALWIVAVCGGFEVPRVLVTCRSQQLEVEGDGDENVPLYYNMTDNITIQFGREEFCLVTDLRLHDEDAVSLCCLGILHLVLLGVEAKRMILNWLLRLENNRPTNEIDKKVYSIFGYTWAFKTWILESFRVTATNYYYRYNRYPRVAAWKKKRGSLWEAWFMIFFHENLPAARLTPDETEARSNW
nr:hypothetical protein [Tanacetum cinerariifolium]